MRYDGAPQLIPPAPHTSIPNVLPSPLGILLSPHIPFTLRLSHPPHSLSSSAKDLSPTLNKNTSKHDRNQLATLKNNLKRQEWGRGGEGEGEREGRGGGGGEGGEGRVSVVVHTIVQTF